MTKQNNNEGIEKEIENIIKEIDSINKKGWMSEFMKILLKGHKTERRHKNIYNLMFKKLCKFLEENDKQKLKGAEK